MKEKKRFGSENLRRGIYLLPNIFTSLNMLCGFYAVIASIDGKFVIAAVAVVIAGLFDNLDGKIARATGSTSQFGVEYDSLADLISFGLAPGVMIYLWALKPLGRMGWLAAFLFVACGALRLARFNTQAGSLRSGQFVGLPIPAAAGMNSVTVLIFHKLGIEGNSYPISILIMVYVLSFLMVSTIKYDSFKKPEIFKKMNFNVLVMTILILVFTAAQPSIALFLFGGAYVISGPAKTIQRYKKVKLKNAAESKVES